ncbi:RING/FYVE/PHD zinc finger superfamily protein [Striga hermonthica]|uniref:RING/FYVE/PHD zinc finger superfamily protein n=1 Tax=Striga hermonthica TaxID=68872 RepID=A0A9N7NPM8_STRHE|nr:RING/FYVE/PHD zinc finger superfamily protein [Striga hermonthica]
MGEHLVNVNELPKPESVGPSQPVLQAVDCGPSGKKPEIVGPSSSARDDKVVVELDDELDDEQTLLIGIGECRICQEEDSIHNLESPCACCGSLKYAHRKCVQHWCNEKGDITCEICHQPYQPDYTAPPRPQSDETRIDIGGLWPIAGGTVHLHDPRLVALAEAERQLFEGDYDEFNGSTNGTAFCRSAALILMALLLLRHALSVTGDGDENDDDASTFFSLFLLRAVGFLLPCYIMIWAINILQRRRQRQEAAALAAARLAILVRAAQSRGGLLVASAQSPVSNSSP